MPVEPTETPYDIFPVSKLIYYGLQAFHGRTYFQRTPIHASMSPPSNDGGPLEGGAVAGSRWTHPDLNRLLFSANNEIRGRSNTKHGNSDMLYHLAI